MLSLDNRISQDSPIEPGSRAVLGSQTTSWHSRDAFLYSNSLCPVTSHFSKYLLFSLNVIRCLSVLREAFKASSASVDSSYKASPKSLITKLSVLLQGLP
jgi:hypothetical protein